MRYILSALSLLLLTTSCTGPQQSMVMDPYKTNEIEKQYKTMLIVGEGNMQAKMYLQNLTEPLIKAFAKKNIDCRYEYLGDHTKTDVEEAFKKVNPARYDAVLQMMPIDLEERTYNGFQKSLAGSGGQVLVGPLISRINRLSAIKNQGNRMVNDFVLTVTEKADTVIWQSRLRAFMDPTSTSFYNGLRNKIMTTLEENKIVSAN